MVDILGVKMMRGGVSIESHEYFAFSFPCSAVPVWLCSPAGERIAPPFCLDAYPWCPLGTEQEALTQDAC